MNIVEKLMNNWKRLKDENPDINEAIKEGYEVAAYDEETGMVISSVLEDGSLKVKVIEDGYVIKKAVETNGVA